MLKSHKVKQIMMFSFWISYSYYYNSNVATLKRDVYMQCQLLRNRNEGDKKNSTWTTDLPTPVD